jgi:hypothetical protein
MRADTLTTVAVLISACAACERVESAPVGADPKKLANACAARDRLAAQHLRTFDELDFDVFSNQRWSRLRESHAQDIVVHWPDGRSAKGIDVHIADLSAMFSYAPDTAIKEHPVKVANGEWTAVTGIIEGTFTKPMTLPDGTTIEPTGKPFKLPLATFGHWTEAGVMDEEYLFFDNGALRDQLEIKTK